MTAPSITCPRCGKVSFNPNDVRSKYCGNCSRYHSDMNLLQPLQSATPPRTDGEFVLGSESDDGKTEVWDRGGVAWHNAPIPSRWHRCRVQTYGYLNWFELYERCACGAIRMDGRFWLSRNERRKS